MRRSGKTARRRATKRDPAWYFVRLGSINDGLEWGLWLGLLIWWIDILAFSPLELALTGTVLQFTVLVMETPTGVLADLHSRKWSVVIGTGLMAVAFGLSVASRTLWVVLAAQVLAGIAWTFRSGASIAWLTDELRGEGRGNDHEIEQLILRRHRWSMGISLAAVSMMMMVGQSSIRLAVVLIAIVQFVLAVAWMFAPERHFSADQSHQTFVRQLRAGLALVTHRPRLMRMLMIVGLTGLGTDALDRLGFKRFVESVGGDAGAGDSVVATGVLVLVLAVGGIIVNLIVTRFVTKQGATDESNDDAEPGAAPLVLVAAVLFAVAASGAMVVALGAPIAVIGIGMLLQDATRESAYPVIESWTNRETTSDVRATVHSLTGQVYALSEMAGGFLLGLLAELTNVPLAVSAGAALFGAGSLLAFQTRAESH